MILYLSLFLASNAFMSIVFMKEALKADVASVTINAQGRVCMQCRSKFWIIVVAALYGGAWLTFLIHNVCCPPKRRAYITFTGKYKQRF